MTLTPSATPPSAERRPYEITRHGVTLSDPYAWLRAENWREVMADPSVLAPDIAAYLHAENDYADAALAPLKPLREELVKELRGRIAEDDWSVPTPDGYHAYGSRYTEGAEHPLIVRMSRAAGKAVTPDAPPRDDEVLLDANQEAEGSAYFRLAAASHSPDHAQLAWAADRTGGELFTLSLRDLASGHDTVLAERVTPGTAFAADSQTLLAVELDDNHRPCRVLALSSGAAPQTLYEEADPGFFVAVSRTLSGRFLVIDSHDHQTSEVRLIDAWAPLSPPVVVAERIEAEEYDVAHHDDALFIRTNREARDFRIVRAPVAAPGRENWEDIVPHRPGILIVAMAVFQDFLVWLERENALPRIIIRRLADGDEHQIAFDEEAYSLGLSEGLEFQTDTLRFTYSSMTTPTEVWDYDMATRERRLRKRQRIPSGHDPAGYVTRRLMAPTADGESVPVSLFHRADTPIDGTAPCLLYGYGSYGITIPASFSANALSLVDRGFVYAIAHVRGGMDKGFDWYDQGRREHKENTFSDFVAAADHLIAEGYTAKGRIAAQGGSAGGMLMGVIANRAPDRFGAIVAEVPFVDVLTTMLDDTLPLTPPEWPEWGDPIRDEAAFRRILSYSPVDNVAPQAYPAMLVLAGVSDPRVTYWEPAKWVARLREAATNDPLILLKTNMDAGHGGASGRFKRLEEVAMVQAFVLATVGRTVTTPAAV
ncbi:S9 family peptidase [Acuticoccus mangrovi]|uniref:S9 family peptidase n=1 Tax=Acuticoccus mangrovi TaxID=2796142 RepID=A0A934IGC7_9HYPH|nr:S9 family peptidase [Acuticoccus mangrovi]MBJ3774481.1 S9 family peptidase [Acuticoccus mangrovi]